MVNLICFDVIGQANISALIGCFTSSEARCWHYTMANDTNGTRVSFDFRVVPIELFDNEHRGPSNTIHRANGKSAAAADIKPLRMGEYYVDSGVDVVDEDDRDDRED